MKKRHVLPKCAMGCFMVLLIVLNVALSWAGLTYDSDGDCDVDGVDLSLLLSVGSPSLSGIALEFGAVEKCCEYIGVGSPIDGYPNWQERTMIVFTNMVRMAPIEYGIILTWPVLNFQPVVYSIRLCIPLLHRFTGTMS